MVSRLLTKGTEAEADGSASTATASSADRANSCVYFCGNSLGLQPKLVRESINAQLETWASLGVYGHFATLGNSPLAPWQDMAEQCARQSTDSWGRRRAKSSS